MKRVFDSAFVDLVAPAMGLSDHVMTRRAWTDAVQSRAELDAAVRRALDAARVTWGNDHEALLTEAAQALAEKRPLQWAIVSAAIGGGPWPAPTPAQVPFGWMARADIGEPAT